MLISIVFFIIDAVQRFIELPTYTEVNPGEDALLKCRISDKKGVCSWQKDNKVCVTIEYGLGQLTQHHYVKPDSFHSCLPVTVI